MDLVDRLIARARGAPTLTAGSFSDLAADAHDDQWIDQCVNDSSEQEARFATELLLRALHTADLIVREIESQGPLLEFFAGTARDILLYESLLFSVHALSDALRQILLQDETSSVTRDENVARLTASILGPQHLGEFNASQHGLGRMQRYLPHVGNLREMSECLSGILISARGATTIELSDTFSGQEVGIEIEVALRSAVNVGVSCSVRESAEKLSRNYSEVLDHSPFEEAFA